MKLKIKDFLLNIKEVFSKPKYVVIFFVVFFLLMSLFNLFTNHELIKGNLGTSYFYINAILQILISFLFAVFVPISIYKFVKFNAFSIKENSTSFIGGLLGILVAGCAACSITFASYVGLAGIVAFLPWYGLELKAISIPLLVYANYSTLVDLNVCKVKKKRKHD